MPSDFSGNKTRLLSPGGARNLSSAYWFGPLTPVLPSAPKGTGPRQWGYTPGANLLFTPKGEDSPISFAILRLLADSWDLLRIAIEMKKGQLASTKFELKLKQEPGETTKDYKKRGSGDKVLLDLRRFFEKPDGIHKWRGWLNMITEDMLVIDAVAVWMARDKGGRVAAAVPLAGDNINRMLTEAGTIPQAGDPNPIAYQQVLYGTIACEFSDGYPATNPNGGQVMQDLIYGMMCERTNKRYGFSPVERILTTINFGIRRQEWQISEYTSGNIPEAMVFLPSDMPPARISEVQDMFDLMLSGDLEKRRRVRFLPGYGVDGKANVVFPKEALLKDELDVWLAQLVCANLGLSFQSFAKMMNRASAEEGNDAAQQEGLKPHQDYVCEICNEIIDRMGLAENYEMGVQQHRDVDPLKAAQADKMITGIIVTINESRETRGLDPDPNPLADQLGVFTPTGFVPLGQQAQQPGPDDEKPGKPKPSSDDEPPPDKKPKPAKKLLKAAGDHVPVTIDPTNEAGTRHARATMQAAIEGFFEEEMEAGFHRLHTAGYSPVEKAAGDPDPMLSAEDILKILLAIEWVRLVAKIQPSMIHAANYGAIRGMAQLQVTDKAVFNESQALARTWATDRAAELVGMKWIDGELVQNPNAKWAISDTTRDKLKALVEDALAEETPIADLEEAIRASDVFSKSRAKMIAKTEIAKAQSQGNLTAWKQTGVVKTAKWLVSSIHDQDDACDANMQAGPIPIGEAFPSGVEAPPDHPRCNCMLVAVEFNRKKAA